MNGPQVPAQLREVETMSNAIIGPNPLPLDMTSPEERVSELRRILTAGLDRLSTSPQRGTEESAGVEAKPVRRKMPVSTATAGVDDDTKVAAVESSNSNPAKSLFTQTDLAKRWSMSERTLESWRSKGRGPKFVKIGGLVRYRCQDIETYEGHQTSGGRSNR